MSDEEVDLDDDFFSSYRNQRMEEMRRNAEKADRPRYTELQEEKDFVEAVKQHRRLICHFYHNDFPRCKILDKHLETVAQEHPEVVFAKIEAERAPFFSEKMKIKVLPCLLIFSKGQVVDRITGFEDFGRDDFKTAVLVKRIGRSGILSPPDEDKDN
eukprot:TRINITY_DN5576_c0_g1_i1.p1 TRINITY_DN5576_c0_g1~~TRINITY_DN5576_c0_g1_i1.p1  ORF type:complete len:157 (-),score=43.52 TRINITY_DN5576_c0_g1_i1:176-646(-)